MKKPKHPSVKRLKRGTYYLLENKDALHRGYRALRPPESPPFYILLKLTHFYRSGVRFEVLSTATPFDYEHTWRYPRSFALRSHLQKLLKEGKLPTGYKTIRYNSHLLSNLVEVPRLNLSLYVGGHSSQHMETALRGEAPPMHWP